MPRNTQSKRPSIEPLLSWLHGLDEPAFRDRVLEEVFKNMKKQGHLGGYRNIHGRNDKGVDYILKERAPLGEQIVGVQVKSNDVTRTKGSNSAVNIKAECVAAMDHVFKLDKDSYKLDRIEVWNSGKTTQDALEELESTSGPLKIGVKIDKAIAPYIEEFAPKYLRTIPEYSIKAYLENGLGEIAGHFSLLGCRLNPEKHFLEPLFVPEMVADLGGVEIGKDGVTKREALSLNEVLDEDGHVVIVGSEMSGKSYTLQHAFTRIASTRDKAIPVLFSGREVESLTKRNIATRVGKKVCGFKKTQVESLTSSYQFILLIDEVDQLREDALEELLTLDPKEFRLIGSAQSFKDRDDIHRFRISGVRTGSITKFLRSIDQDLVADGSFTDRAQNFIGRVTGSSALPQTPFVVAACLQQCGSSGSTLNTPTFGLLIESFVQEQTGVRNRSATVDYESKRDFLALLADAEDDVIPIERYEEVLDRFIEDSDNPHSASDFTGDLEASGILRRSRDGGLVSWANSVYRKYYWVRRSVDCEETESIEKMLLSQKNPTLAAIYASVVGKCDGLIERLIDQVSDLAKPEELDSSGTGSLDGLYIEDDDHDEFLKIIEATSSIDDEELDRARKGKTKEVQQEFTFSEDEKKKILSSAQDLVAEMEENKFFAIVNLGALMLNGRRSSREIKADSLVEVVHAVMRFGRSISRIMVKHFDEEIAKNFAWIVMLSQIQMVDRIIGDAYLRKTFSRYPASDLRADERLIVAELKLTHGEISDDEFIDEIRDIDLVQVTIAAHMRMAVMYFYRYQKPIEKKRIAALMKKLGKLHKRARLPGVRPTKAKDK